MINNLPRFIKYGSIEEIPRVRDLKTLFEQDLRVFEKIDGGLCQVRKRNGRLLPGSKANYLTGALVERNEWFGKFLGWTYGNSGLYSLPENMILFGEWSGHHTIDYGANNDKFFLIDILNLDSQRFMKYEDSVKFVQDLNIPGVNVLPVLASGKVDKSTLDRFLQRTSDYYDGPKEGLVIKDYNPHPQKFVKILNKGFAEQRAKIFGRIDPFTEARIRKNILHALEEIDMNELTLERLYEFIQDDVRKETDRYYTLDYIRRRAEPNLRKMWELQGKEFPSRP